MKRFLLIKGGVETEEYFSFRIADVLIARGYEVLVFSLWDFSHLEDLKNYLARGDVVLLTFNFHGLEREEIFLDRGGNYLWDRYGVSCINIVVDHPFYYHPYLLDTPKNYAQICIDFSHESYMKRFYPQVSLLSTMPLAGTQIQERKPWKERRKAIVFTGNYTPLETFKHHITGQGKEYEAFYWGMIEELKCHTRRTMEEVFEEHMKREMGDLSMEELRLGMSKLIFIDLYIRFYFRGEVVRAIADTGIPIFLFGNGWDRLSYIKNDAIHLGGPLDSEGCLEKIADFQLSLNVMPWFKKGAHDRIYNSMMNGAVSFSDRSEYLIEKWTDGEDILFYSLDEIKDIKEKLQDAFAHPKRLEAIADCAYEKVKKANTWEHFTCKVLDEIKENVE